MLNSQSLMNTATRSLGESLSRSFSTWFISPDARSLMISLVIAVTLFGVPLARPPAFVLLLSIVNK